ncbi:MAG: DNA (cytosine-5-)-methyltransferase [Candidatus Kaiserbacteria bacterium]|nr:DNA (cytosine-5-)-methyltransferase [Candidatus Kaiserbacteria bacterium]
MSTFIDLFCGIGGFRIALERRGMCCVFSSDIDEHARHAYRENFGEMPYGDIREIAEKDIPKHDILCAGFPCQSFSISGNRGGLGDERGRLFYEVVRIAKYHKPSILLLENVKNILTVENGSVIRTIERDLKEIGYSVQYSTLNASHFGVPQSRERVYFACVRDDLKSSRHFDYTPPEESHERVYLEDVLEDVIDETLYVNRDDIVIQKQPKEYALRPLRVGMLNKGGAGRAYLFTKRTRYHSFCKWRRCRGKNRVVLG